MTFIKGMIPWNKDKSTDTQTKNKMSASAIGRHSSNKGKHLTEEHKRKLSNAKIGKKLTEETKTKMSKSRIQYLNSEIGKKQTELLSLNRRGCIISEEVRQKMSLSQTERKLSEDHKKKISKTKKGTVISEETRKKMSISRKGNRNCIGVKQSKEVIESRIKYIQGIPQTIEHRKKISISNIGKKMSTESRKKMSVSRKGKRCGSTHPNWKGGISKLPYCEKWIEELREEVRNKYDRKCFICNKDEKDNITKDGNTRKLSVHHIYYDKQEGCNGKEMELIPLCTSCHMKTNYNTSYWTKHINSLIKYNNIKEYMNNIYIR